MNMRLKALFLVLLISSAAGCSGDKSLQGAFERQMKDNEVDGFNIIHMEENENDGLVLFTSWTSDYPQNKDKPGIYYYEKVDKAWKNQTGSDCSGTGVSRLGLMGNGQLYCASLKDSISLESIRVGDSEAKMFPTPGGGTVWYARAGERDLKAVGVTSDGREIMLN